MAQGTYDELGIWNFGPDDYAYPFHEVLNKLPASLRAVLGTAWTPYTPQLLAGDIGNGTILGRYRKLGRTVHLDVWFAPGSTTTFTGTAQFTLPVAARDSTFGIGSGVKMVGASTSAACTTRFNNPSQFYVFEVAGSGLTPVGPSATIGSTTTYRISLTYESAS